MTHYRVVLRRRGGAGRFHVEKYLWDPHGQQPVWTPCNVETTTLRLATEWAEQQQAAELPLDGNDGEYVVWQS